MINFKQLLETVYEPKSGDEKNFKDKHVVVKYKTPFDSESQFTSDKPKAKRKADHDKGEDEAVYEAAQVHTKRADKEAVIVRAVDPNTGESKARVVQRRAGEIKIGEEVEQIDELSDDKLQSYHAKAGADRLKAKAEVEKGMAQKKFTPASVQKTADSYKRFVKRGKGMTLAAQKMREEVELEEGTVGHGKYTITTGPKMSGMGEGGPSHVVAKRAKMAKLGVPHHDEPGEYGHTVKVTVKNNETGETTHHHVYQRDTDKGSKEALVSTRSVGTPRAKQKDHEKVLHNYLSGKKVSSLKEESVVVTELGEKVANPYAIGMATAMKKAGDTPPLKKSTIVKGHEIAKSIMKNEAMDKVGKEDSDIDNDGDTDKSDKYLHARRKAIGKALRKEEVDQLDELSPNTLHRYIKKATPDVAARAISAVAPNQSSETKKHASKLGKRIQGITSASGRLSDKANMNEAAEYTMKQLQKKFDDGTHEAMNDPKPGYHVELRNTKTGKRTSHYVKEDIEQIDELSKKTLGSYVKKAGGTSLNSAGAYMADYGANNNQKSFKKGINRAKGVMRAADRLTKEEVELDEGIKEKISGVIRREKQKEYPLLQARLDVAATKAGAAYAAGDHKKGDRYMKWRDDNMKKEEVEMIDEAVKVGAMKLHDGSTVNVTRAMADSLNGVFEQLNPMNRVKMEQKLHMSKKDFDEILKFAENVNG